MNNLSILSPRPGDHELIDDLCNWLPDKIIDSHVHCHDNFGQELFNRQAASPGQTFNWFNWARHIYIWKKLVSPIRDYRAIVFGLPFGSSEERNNDNLERIFWRQQSVYAAACLTSRDASDRLMAAGYRPNGFKTKIRTKGQEGEIINNFSEALWAIIDRQKNFLIIHLPRNIFDNADELVFLADKYPGINFVAAHLGGFFLCDDRLEAALAKVAKRSNIFFDTAMVTDSDSICVAASMLGCHKILFGSDAPFGYLRGRFVRQDGGTIFQTSQDWPWAKLYPLGANQPTADYSDMVCLSSIRAIKEGLAKAKKSDIYSRHKIFFLNSHNLLKGLQPSF